MFNLSRFGRGRAATPRARTVFRVEDLEGRFVPSGPELVRGDVTGSGAVVQIDDTANHPPQIVDFTAEEVGVGLFLISGRVVDEQPAGLVVAFGGSVGSVAGRTANVLSDGSFSLTVRVRLDGTNTGFVTATVADAGGLTCEEVMIYISPTAPG